MKMMSGFTGTKDYDVRKRNMLDDTAHTLHQASSQFASQAIEHIRSVAALGRLGHFLDDYRQSLAGPSAKLGKAAHMFVV